MNQKPYGTTVLAFYMCISVFSFIMTLMIALGPPVVDGFLVRKPVVGALFILVCASGIVAAFNPRVCSRGLHRSPHDDLSSKARSERKTVAAGHHPACDKYSAHTVRLGCRVLCAACVGLALGASVAIIVAIFYFLLGWHIGGAGLVFVVFGLASVVAGFLQLLSSGLLRLALNSVFVLGTLMVLVGIDWLAQSLLSDLLLSAGIVFWLFVRIGLSEWDHWRTCRNCLLSYGRCPLNRTS